MPEGPEIRRAADALFHVIQDSKLTLVKLDYPPIQSYRRRIVGSKITKIEAHGKALVTRFDSGLNMYSHNQLYGLWETTKPDAPYLSRRQLRLELGSDKDCIRLYSATDIQFLSDQGLKVHPYLQKLGPDVLESTTTPDDIVDRLTSSRFANQTLGSLYLNQHFLAGIGNYLRSEILFRAGLSADLRPRALSRKAIRNLAKMTLTISRDSYRQAGVTRRMSEYRADRARGADFEAARFWVFDRLGQPCYQCNSAIEIRYQNQRRYYYCNKCQVQN